MPGKTRKMFLKIVRKILIKINARLEGKPEIHPYLQKQESSFVRPKNPLDFRVGKEKRTYVSIGERCIVNATFTFESLTGEVLIGNNVHLGRVHFICKTKIIVGDDVTMAWGITIYDHNSHSIYWEKRKNDNNQCYTDYLQYGSNNIRNKNWDYVVTKPVIIESKVWVGFDVIILKGVTIGEGAVIGAKSVVTKNVEPWTVVAGNPAVVVKYLPEYNNKK